VGVIYVYRGRQTQTETRIPKGGGHDKIVCIEYKSRFLFSHPYTNYLYLMHTDVWTITKVLLYDT